MLGRVAAVEGFLGRGGGVQYDKGGDVRWTIKIKLLKETNLGITLFDIYYLTPK